MKFDVHIALTMMTVFWWQNLYPGRQVPEFILRRKRQHVAPKRWYPSFNLHGVTSQKYLQNCSKDFFKLLIKQTFKLVT